MLWRKTRAAIEQFPPAHQTLIWQRVLHTAHDRDGWAHLARSLQHHDVVVKRSSWALPPRTLDVVVPLVHTLCQDMAAGDVLAVTADLRGQRLPEKVGPQRQLPVLPPVRRATEWMVVDPWLRLRASLRDGSVLEVVVVDRVRHRKVSKVTYRGKYKTKTKTKETQLIKVTRRLPRGATGQRPAYPPPPWIRVRIRPGKRLALTAIGRLNRLSARAGAGAPHSHRRRRAVPLDPAGDEPRDPEVRMIACTRDHRVLRSAALWCRAGDRVCPVSPAAVPGPRRGGQPVPGVRGGARMTTRTRPRRSRTTAGASIRASPPRITTAMYYAAFDEYDRESFDPDAADNSELDSGADSDDSVAS